MTHIEYRLKGIPCIIEVHTFRQVKGSYSFNAPSDWDYYGYTDIEYEVLDRKGYKAKWLENKVDDDAHASIKEAIVNYFSQDDYC